MNRVNIIPLIHACQEQFTLSDDAEQTLEDLRLSCQDTSKLEQPVEVAIEALIELAEKQIENAKDILFAAARIGRFRPSTEAQLDFFQPELIARCAIADLASESDIDWAEALDNACSKISGIDEFATTHELRRMLVYVYRARAMHDFLQGSLESAMQYLGRYTQIQSLIDNEEDSEEVDGDPDKEDFEVSFGQVMRIVQELLPLDTMAAYQAAYDIIAFVEDKTEWETGEEVVTQNPSSSVGARLGLFLSLTKSNDRISDEQKNILDQVRVLLAKHSHDPQTALFVQEIVLSSAQPIPDDISALSVPTSLNEVSELMGITNSLVEAGDGPSAVSVIELARSGLQNLDGTRSEFRNFYVVATKAYYSLSETWRSGSNVSEDELQVASVNALIQALKYVDLAIEFEDDAGRPRSSLFNRKSKILYDLGRYEEAMASALEALEHAENDEKSLHASIVSRIAAHLSAPEQLAGAARSFLKNYVAGLLRASTQIERLAYCSERRGQLQFTALSLCDGGFHPLAFKLWEAGKAIDMTLSVENPQAHGSRRALQRAANFEERIERIYRLLGDRQSTSLRLKTVEDAYGEVQALVDDIVTSAMGEVPELPDGVLYLSYCLHKEKEGWLFMLNGRTFTYEKLSFGIEEARQPMKPSVDEMVPLSVQDEIGNAKQVIISPDDALWTVPFAVSLNTLRDREFSLIESLNLLRLPRDSNSLSIRDMAAVPAIVAGATYADTSSPLHLSNLAIRQVARRYGEGTVQVATNESFTKPALLNLIRREPRMLHIVGHALFKKRKRGDEAIAGQAFQSGIQVRPVELGQTEASASGSPADVLTVLDLEQVTTPIDLITLSCCQSGFGEPLTEGLAGLPLGLRCVGTRALVGTLTKTLEVGTLFVMDQLHRYLAEGATIGHAMLKVRSWVDSLSDTKLTTMSEWLSDQPETRLWLAADKDNSTEIGYLRSAIQDVQAALILIGDPNVRVV